MTIAYECGRRRAEIDGLVVSFLRVTGHVRKSVNCVWWMTANSDKQAKRLALRWIRQGRLGKAVI